jgi:uncharacterized protein YbbC (DUF1343 family)
MQRYYFRIIMLVLVVFAVQFAFGQEKDMPKRPKMKVETGNVYPGIDVLMQRNCDILAGKKVGLITNHTGISREGFTDIELLYNNKTCNLVALFSPEHGISGTSDTGVASSKDSATNLPIYSLYGKTQKPTPEMLKDIDVLVFDMQDIGCRFYTYIGTMAYAMKAAKENGKKFVVLDRPNPIGGEKVEGAVPLEKNCGGNTCIYPIPTRHGMTIGELALMFNDHFKIGCDLEVVPMKNWVRWMYFDQTGLLWLNPSPNMKTLNGAILYPGPGSLEATVISPGRGTDHPFEMYGAPFIDGRKLADNLAKRNTPGVRFVPYQFIPSAQYHQFKDQTCFGVFAIITDRIKLDSIPVGLHLAQALYENNTTKYRALDGYKTLSGDTETWNMLTEKKLTPEEIVTKWQKDIDTFNKARQKYLLY